LQNSYLASDQREPWHCSQPWQEERCTEKVKRIPPVPLFYSKKNTTNENGLTKVFILFLKSLCCDLKKEFY